MGLLNRDIELRLDLTDRCNLKCIMCFKGYETGREHSRNSDMTADFFKKITGEILPRVNVLHLSAGYEPLLNKELPAILSVIKEKNVPQVVMTSNLMALTDHMADLLTDGYIHELHVSMDAADKNMYEMIRQKGDFDRVVSNLKKINHLKILKKSKYPKIVFNYVLMKINFNYLKDFVDFSASHGINEINCAEFRVPYNYQKSLLPFGSRGLPADFDLADQHIDYSSPDTKKALIQLVKYASHKGIFLNVPYKFDLNGSGKLMRRKHQVMHLWKKSSLMTFRAKMAFGLAYLKKYPTYRKVMCSFPWRQIILTATGEVLPCCTWSGSPSMGNIHQEPLSRIWNNEKYLNVRAGIRHGNYPDACKQCIVAMKKRHGI
ncbi:MAG: radical SAM protein [Desulfobacteraceae bacterium]|nr:radical SAM protein [Desulfobacteraceae bacterium]MBC2757529.1 radical SAM protein [Desulfobacteraceae bacterium]